MSDLISREQAIGMVNSQANPYGLVCIEAKRLEDMLKNLPSAEPNRDMIHLQKEQAYMQGWADGQEALRKEIWKERKNDRTHSES